jgi:hypothetical protein
MQVTFTEDGEDVDMSDNVQQGRKASVLASNQRMDYLLRSREAEFDNLCLYNLVANTLKITKKNLKTSVRRTQRTVMATHVAISSVITGSERATCCGCGPSSLYLSFLGPLFPNWVRAKGRTLRTTVLCSSFLSHGALPLT